MCKPELTPFSTKNVIIAGAGPAGLLLTALLMQRNQEQTDTLYRITLVDGRADMGQFSDEEMKGHRSWMLSLAGHGLEALRECHGLYDEYCTDVGILLKEFNIHLGKKELKTSVTDNSEQEGFIIDRNYMVAALARFVNDKMDKTAVTTRYETKLMYVDYENHRVLVRSNKTQTEDYLNYDLLVGCDGVRSVVREALIKRHPTFEMDVGDIFQKFKAVHVELPKGLNPAAMHLLPNAFPFMNGIALPETGNMLNLTMGLARHNFDKLPDPLKSDNVEVVAAYVKENFKPFELVDYNDFAEQWVNQRWNRTGQVHCNFYHSQECGIVIMGDAAHATSPSIGMGMNQALKDAQCFYRLLQQHKDNLTEALPKFSKTRVKEGNSLSDLAMHLYCLETTPQLVETLHIVIRGTLHNLLPKLIAEHPQSMIGVPKYSLSQVYDHALKLGIISKHRRINNEVRQKYFEEEMGMVSTPEEKFVSGKTLLLFSGVAAAVGFALLRR